MQAAKILTVVVLMVVVAMGSEIECNNRKAWIKPFSKQTRKQRGEGVWCHEPIPTIVPVPLPQRMKYINPYNVSVPRCPGLRKGNKICMGKQTEERTFKVEGFTDTSMSSKVCLEIPIEADVTCHLECDKSLCTEHQIQNEFGCECSCPNKVQERECRERMDHGDMVMWDVKFCSCPCNNQDTKCGSGEVFDMDVCRCVLASTNDINK